MKRFGTLALISIGFIAGITFVYSCGGFGSSSAAAVGTGYLSIGYEGFHADDPTDPSYDSYASLNLPHNSRINSITGYFTDTHVGSSEVIFHTFNRDGTLAATRYIETTNISGYGSETLSFPGGLVIDNINYYYCFRYVNPTPVQFAFHSVLVEYEYDI